MSIHHACPTCGHSVRVIESAGADPDPVWDDIYGEDGTAARPQGERSLNVERLAQILIDLDLVSHPELGPWEPAQVQEQARMLAERIAARLGVAFNVKRLREALIEAGTQDDGGLYAFRDDALPGIVAHLGVAPEPLK